MLWLSGRVTLYSVSRYVIDMLTMSTPIAPTTLPTLLNRAAWRAAARADRKKGTTPARYRIDPPAGKGCPCLSCRRRAR